MIASRTFRGLRLHIGIFGRRNVGKSSLLNALTGQQVSIVSPVPGTTTDPVEKPMEYLPLGPVQFIDTAGIDDTDALGPLRIQKTRKILERTDIGLVVAEGAGWGEFEEQILSELVQRGSGVVVVFNKGDLARPPDALLERLRDKKIRWAVTSATRGEGLAALRQALLDACPDDYINSPPLAGDLLEAGETAVLVVPIDREAPRGRLILPQVQTIRDLLDHRVLCLVTGENELSRALSQLRVRPGLVITDSQAFVQVAEATPADVPLTSFSVLFSRFKGDLRSQVEAVRVVDSLRPGERVLVAEACSHHPIADDIGRVKIPRWLNRYAGGELIYETVQGHDFPENLSPYRLVIHCGACMINRREMLSRLLRCRGAGVPCTNYGLLIARSLGILERALGPFPEALEYWRSGGPAG